MWSLILVVIINNNVDTSVIPSFTSKSKCENQAVVLYNKIRRTNKSYLTNGYEVITECVFTD